MKQAKASDQEVETLLRWLQRMDETDLTPPPWARVVFGYQVLKDNVCDPAKDFLDWKPGESPAEIQALRNELEAVKAEVARLRPMEGIWRLQHEQARVAREERDAWRKCAEMLATQFRAYGKEGFAEEALAEFDRLKKENP
jgi:hypothetical protein